MSDKIKNILQLTVVFSVLTISGLLASGLRLISFGKLIVFNRKYLMAFTSKLILKLVGIKLVLPSGFKLSSDHEDERVFITFNHNSYLDIFALTAMGLSNVSFLLSEKTLKIVPLTFAAYGIGIIYIPQKKNKERRRKFFKKLEHRIQNKNLNIAGASEGVHDHHHGIDKFNRGVYRMAMKGNMTIRPLFIYVPKESNPFNKYKYFKRGVVKVDELDQVKTDQWNEEELDNKVIEMRNKYVNYFNKVHQATVK